MTVVSTTAIRAKIHVAVPMVRATCLLSRAPVPMAMSTVVPVVRPVMMPVTVCITWLPMATPATLAASSNCPTTKRSAPP